MSTKYYFLSCECEKGVGWFAVNVVLDEHPLDWIAGAPKEERYRLITWNEITKEVYERHHDKFS